LIARRWEAFVNSLAVNWSEDTSRNCIACINSAKVIVVTENWILDKISTQAIASVGVAFVLLSKSLEIIFRRVDTSFNGIASIFGARIGVSANNWSVSALSRRLIARIGGTCIVVVTILSIVFADSS
jgi:hypothetical protein